jgi:hypothetical protein
MSLEPELVDIQGAQELYDWFEYWPTFHDAEIVSLHLNRSCLSSLVIHTWEMTDKIDERNFYVLVKHVVVEFSLSGVSGLNLTGFSVQNVIGDLSLEKTSDGFRLELGPCYGLAGTINVEKISIRLTPGKPTN